MKKLLITGITALSLLLVMPMPTWAEDKEEIVSMAKQIKSMKDAPLEAMTPKITYASKMGVNIRDEPNTESKILGQNLLDTSFEVLNEYDGLSMITTENGYAFIKSEYLSDTETSLKYLGWFKISHYCCEPYKHICGDENGLTRTGVPIHPGLISVAPSIIPLGSIVEINGVMDRAEDTGGMIKGYRIDTAVDSHEKAKKMEIYYVDV